MRLIQYFWRRLEAKDPRLNRSTVEGKETPYCRRTCLAYHTRARDYSILVTFIPGCAFTLNNPNFRLVEFGSPCLNPSCPVAQAPLS